MSYLPPGKHARCPFCGSDAHLYVDNLDMEAQGDWTVECANPVRRSNHPECCARGPFAKTMEDAVKFWDERASEEWRPIETAPMDGTVVVARFKGDRRVAYYDTHEEWWRDVYSGCSMSGGRAPTHWQPLASLPGEQGERYRDGALVRKVVDDG